MRFPFWRETRSSGYGRDPRSARPSGSITLLVVFVSFLFSAIGLGLFMISRVYRQWSLVKNDTVLLRTAAENGAREGFGAVGAALLGQSFPLHLSAAEYDALRASARNGGIETLETVLGRMLPMQWTGTAGAGEWTTEVGFQPENIMDGESFFAAAFEGEIVSRGRLTGRPRIKRTVLQIGMSVMAGCVPLSAFPFLLAADGAPEQAFDLMAENKLVLAAPETGGPRLPAAATDQLMIPSEALPQLSEALKIDFFSPSQLTAARIRQALGLPISNDPIPDGVYLASDDLGLGGVFVQGDVEEMLLAASGGRQYMQFQLEEGTWRLWFSPSERKTSFSGPEGIRSMDSCPRPIVLVNGSIASLGGATTDDLGNLTLSLRTDTPAVLAGVSLMIVSSGETVISSHLIQEGVRWTDGLPYLKESTAQLCLFASGSDLLSGTDTQGRIRIGAGAPADVYIQASLTAHDGFRIDGSERNVILSGGLQAAGLEAGSNRLTIRPDGRLLSGLAPPAPGPRSTVPVLFPTGWEARKWTDR